MDPSDARQLIIIAILILLSAFFSSAETAFTSVNRLHIRSLMEEKVKGAATVFKLVDEPSKMLSTVLIGNNIVNLSASSLLAALAVKLWGSTAVGAVTGILTLLILLFGEIMPKTIATIHAEKIAFFYAPVILLLSRLLTPVIFLLEKISISFLFLIRIDPSKKKLAMTENELRAILDVSHEEGVIESAERKMITNVVDFGDSLVSEIMVPRIDMSLASADMNYQELVDAFKKEQYSRLPVYQDNRDNIIGIINLKDLFFFQEADKEKFNLGDFLRTPYFTYEFKKTSELLTELRNEKISIAIVLDEYGSAAGLVTVEDLLEEIVGEIRDEYDMDEVDPVQKTGENEYIAEGSARLDEINEQTGLELASEDYDSIAGHVIHLLDRLPVEGEVITENNAAFLVASVIKNRIDKIHITITPEAKDTECEED